MLNAHLAPIWYHPEPSDFPYSPNQFLGWDFFCHFLQQDGSNLVHKTFKNLPFFLASFIVSILINANLFIKSPSLSSFPLKKSA